jgi:hypothetical protein
MLPKKKKHQSLSSAPLSRPVVSAPTLRVDPQLLGIISQQLSVDLFKQVDLCHFAS